MNKKQEKGFEEKILAGIRECKNEANKKMVFNGYGIDDTGDSGNTV